MLKLRPHKNIVSLIGLSESPQGVCIVTEYCSGGTLFDLIHN